MGNKYTINRQAGVCAAKGFTAGGIHAGIKKDSGKKDLAIICCEVICNAAALFTTNKVQAAPIKVSKNHIKDNRAQAVIVNSGNANACTENAAEVAEKMCELTAARLGVKKEDVIVASTGVIGQRLDIKPIVSGISSVKLSRCGCADAVEAIMTTDTFAKRCAVEFELGIIGGIAKGSGMINPNMGTCTEATMLSFITTDVDIPPELLSKALCEVNARTFNMVSVDGDTSTNDMVCIMASGLAGKVQNSEDYEKFTGALYAVMERLAKDMARDGEGATKLIECNVSGAPDETVAKSIAKSVISSSLVKAALGAADANWGRILCAIGYANGQFAVDDVQCTINDITVCENGAGVDFSEEEAFERLSKDEIIININLYCGNSAATAWGCDLTQEYVKINADYRS
jgi:glutamate N-acetyltransferase/amino-acid N-acetyltransferase